MKNYDSLIESVFFQILAEENYTVSKSRPRIQVLEDSTLDSRFAIDFRGDTIQIIYNGRRPKCKGVEELRWDLRHEFCHLVTLPTLMVTVPNNADAHVKSVAYDYVDIFREWLAEREYMRRFPADKGYIRYRHALFPGDMALKSLGNLVALGDSVPQQVFILECFRVFFRLIYDSVSYHVWGDDTYLRWCSARGIPFLNVLFLCVMETVELISDKPIEYLDKLGLMSDSFGIAIKISLYEVMTNKRLRFLSTARSVDVAEEIKSLWLKRIPLMK